MPEHSVIRRTIRVAAGRFAPGHLGELTQVIPFEMVDDVLAETGTVQARIRDLPSRVVIYLLLAAGLFAGCGYEQVWARLTCGLEGLTVATPTSSGLAQARRRIGVKPLHALFTLLAGPPSACPRWRGLLLCAMDGTTMSMPDSPANLAVYGRQTGSHGGSGYPLLRLLAVVTCGSRTVVGMVFGPISVGETTYAPQLLSCLRPGMLLLADRNFAVKNLAEQVAATGAELLIRCKNNRHLPAVRHCPDGSWLALLGGLTVRVIDAEITVTTADGVHHRGHYRLITTLTDHRQFPALDVITLYHQRWEIETAFLELKSTTLAGRVLRAQTPAGIAQEVYALLTGYQALRLAMASATDSDPAINADRASFTIALNTARDQVIHAAGIIAGTTIDLVGKIGRAVLHHPLPERRSRPSPRIVKRAISKHRAKGAIARGNHKTTVTTTIRPGSTTSPEP
ncbi:IS4 family transposase [Catenuloplanes sp. NPDC051500]|uniref:IS4 family transposase n=1 Tax=Catenuloplanes sp. NPDC051500 TaxID=3363959 RepID=UPI0037B76AA2